jgi:hypothetical protein
VLLLCALLARPVFGQINTEKLRSFDVDGFATTLGGDVSLESGNADLFEIGVRSRFDARRGRHYGFLTGEVRYGEEDGQTFRDRSFVHLRYTYRVLPWLVPETFTQVQDDGFKLLQLRVLYGLGVRLRYIDTERIKVFQGTTPMYEYENLDGSRVVDHPVTVSTVRWSNYMNVRLRISDTTYLINTVYVQPVVGNTGDYRVLDEASLGIKITEHVLLRVAFVLNYDSQPPDNVEGLDIALRNGLEVTF